MGQAVWTGSISFGLVNIPVKLSPATEPKDVRFHLYDRRSGKRVHYERVTRDYEPPVFEPEQPIGQQRPPFELGARRPMPRSDEQRWEPERDQTSGGRSDVDVPSRMPSRADELDPSDDLADSAPPFRPTIEASDVVRGLELPSGGLVTVSESELQAIAPE